METTDFQFDRNGQTVTFRHFAGTDAELAGHADFEQVSDFYSQAGIKYDLLLDFLINGSHVQAATQGLAHQVKREWEARQTAETMARVTGSVKSTARIEHVDVDGNLTVEAEATQTRLAAQFVEEAKNLPNPEHYLPESERAFWGTYRDVQPGDQVRRIARPTTGELSFYPGFVKGVQFWGPLGPVDLQPAFQAGNIREYAALHPSIQVQGSDYAIVVNPDEELWITRR